MPKDVRKVICCYCGATNLVSLRESGAITCTACTGRLSGERMQAIPGTPAPAQPQPRRTVEPAPRSRRRDDDDDDRKRRYRRYDDDDDDRPRRKKRKKSLFARIWDEIEDIID